MSEYENIGGSWGLEAEKTLSTQDSLQIIENEKIMQEREANQKIQNALDNLPATTKKINKVYGETIKSVPEAQKKQIELSLSMKYELELGAIRQFAHMLTKGYESLDELNVRFGEDKKEVAKLNANIFVYSNSGQASEASRSKNIIQRLTSNWYDNGAGSISSASYQRGPLTKDNTNRKNYITWQADESNFGFGKSYGNWDKNMQNGRNMWFFDRITTNVFRDSKYSDGINTTKFGVGNGTFNSLSHKDGNFSDMDYSDRIKIGVYDTFDATTMFRGNSIMTSDGSQVKLNYILKPNHLWQREGDSDTEPVIQIIGSNNSVAFDDAHGLSVYSKGSGEPLGKPGSNLSSLATSNANYNDIRATEVYKFTDYILKEDYGYDIDFNDSADSSYNSSWGLKGAHITGAGSSSTSGSVLQGYDYTKLDPNVTLKNQIVYIEFPHFPVQNKYYGSDHMLKQGDRYYAQLNNAREYLKSYVDKFAATWEISGEDDSPTAELYKEITAIPTGTDHKFQDKIFE